jgi:hypothetical protein
MKDALVYLAAALVALWGASALVVVVTAVSGADAVTSHWVYRIGAALLLALAVLTAVTGARTPVVWFKVCPLLLSSAAAVLLVVGFG